MNIKQNLKIRVKKYFPGLVYPLLGKLNPYLCDRIKILNHLGIDTFFDIGANIGQYAHNLRYFNYNSKIVSFEPLSSAFDKMKYLSDTDDNWLIRNYGLGSENKKMKINISENSVSSSFLENSDTLTNIVPQTRYIANEIVEIKRLDSVVDEFSDSKSKIFAKIDAQGYETEVIEGSKGCIDRIYGFQIEMPFVELYKGEKTFFEMNDFMNNLGFKLVAIEPGWSNPITGYAVEVDGIFVRK